jgi:hypothetical protein
MANTRMEAARDIQSDVLSVIKRISRYTVDTQPHLLWYLADHDVLFHYGQLNQFRRQCERAMESCLDGQKVAPRKVPKHAYFNRIFEDLLECLHLEHNGLESVKESFQELLQTRNAGNTPFNRTPSNTYDGTSPPLTNNMNAVLLPQISTQELTPEPEESAEQSDDSSDTSSDSDEFQTLTDDSDDEAIPNIQRINLLFMSLEDPDYNYNNTEDELNNS